MKNYGTISAILRHKGSEVWTVSPENTVLEAIALMMEKNVGALLVSRGDKPVGIFSERDYARKVELAGKRASDVRVAEVIAGHLLTVTPSHTLEECMRLMSNHRVRHLPVLQEGRVAGIVSIGDLVNWIISTQTETIMQLESYITGHYPESP